MANEKTSMAQSSKTPEKIPLTSRVLLIDSDSTSLIALSTVLEHFGYTVTAATEGYQALCILLQKQKEFDFILADSNLADIDKYEFLETARQVSSLPILILSADYCKKDILGCLFKGSTFYILKPIDEKKAKALWQFSFVKTSVEEEKPMQGNGLVEHQTAVDATDQKTEGDNVTEKRNSFWDPAFQDRFLEAVRTFGVDDAQPQKILDEVNAFWLQKHHVASHLQKNGALALTDQEGIMNPDEMEINGPIALGNSEQEQLPPPPPEQENGDENEVIDLDTLFHMPKGVSSDLKDYM